MIANHWYPILESREVGHGKAVGVTRLGEKMVLWRDAKGAVSCLADRCPHRGAAFSMGSVHGDCVQCPFHGFLFDSTGRCTLIPANGSGAPVPPAFDARSFAVREAHDLIWVWWGKRQAEYPPLPFFEEIDRSFSYATFVDHWPVHYTRAIENQLDVAHLPFVHGSTIGRGKRTLVNGPLVTVSGSLMDIWVYNRVDDGTRPLRPGDIPPPQRPPFLQFRFPNVWQNRISENIRVFLAFVPVDEANTLIYMRYYHRTVQLPGIRKLVSLAGILSSIVILRQDKRVVLTQRPIKSDIAMKEKLIPADRPIVAFRAKRRELMEQHHTL